MISLLLMPVSCKQQEAAKKAPASDNASPEITAPLDRPETTPAKEEREDCEKDAKKDEHDDEEDDEVEEDEDDELDLRLTGSSKTTKKKKNTKTAKTTKVKKPAPTTVTSVLRGFGLLASDPNYDDDISSIFKDKCESCHSGTNKNALDTFKKAKALKDKIKSEVASGNMPPEEKSPLTSSEKTAIKNWVAAGAPESSDDSEEAEDEEEEDEDKEDEDEEHSDCDEKEEQEDEDQDEDDDDTTKPSAADWDELLKKKEVEKCKDKGKIFDRLNETCHKAKIAEYSCNKAGIVAEFKKVGVNVSSQLDDFMGSSNKYIIDQCGQHNNEPIVLFYKKETVKEELKLLIKKLCKKGSSACDN